MWACEVATCKVSSHHCLPQLQHHHSKSNLSGRSALAMALQDKHNQTRQMINIRCLQPSKQDCFETLTMYASKKNIFPQTTGPNFITFKAQPCKSRGWSHTRPPWVAVPPVVFFWGGEGQPCRSACLVLPPAVAWSLWVAMPFGVWELNPKTWRVGFYTNHECIPKVKIHCLSPLQSLGQLFVDRSATQGGHATRATVCRPEWQRDHPHGFSVILIYIIEKMSCRGGCSVNKVLIVPSNICWSFGQILADRSVKYLLIVRSMVCWSFDEIFVDCSVKYLLIVRSMVCWSFGQIFVDRSVYFL